MNLPLILLILPFAGAVAAYLLGRFKTPLAFWVAEITGAILFGVSLLLLMEYRQPIDIPLEWYRFGDFAIPFGIYIDKLSLVMLLIATGLGFLDIHFAHDYMGEDPHQPRYYAKVLFFIGGMILLVSAKELVPLFVGWEFMGLASYLLISFWHQKKEPADAGVSAFLFTRFGDIFLFAAIGSLYYVAGTLDMVRLNELAASGTLDRDFIFVMAVFIFIAAIGKSGQFPLFPWLMRAMEGPTTVSALIHGATMVNSGIYIVARLFDFYMAAEALAVVASIGALSAFIGATSALVQREMKKVLAYSTMSHLSIAFVGLGAGSLAAGMTHLVNHAVFKALLFLSAGAIMLAAHHVKDLWRLGGLGKKLTYTALFMGMGVLSLAGIPPFSGFHSKDAVIAHAIANPQTTGLLALLVTVAGLLSMAYGGRLWVLIFAGKPRDKKLNQSVKPPSKLWIVLPLGIMAAATLLMGFYQEPIAEMVSEKGLTAPHVAGLLPFMLITIALLAWLVWFYYARRLDLVEKIAAQPLMQTIHKVLFNGYFIEYLILWFTRSFIVQSFARAVNWSDRRLVDGAIDATLPFSKKTTTLFARFQPKRSGENAGAMALGLLLLLIALWMGGAV
ncbi:NADH-quinone oxidoreductase subunit 5 family protein [Hydrogenimonas urashimensis]|uniref:NADH-quinone oxidoreductase subunit 5 family protein n=1 Tax=Hydrogenimonas urashimensis TaxID=2740515 RepID=UPI0019151494|nr:NADH-quinone oxidoreductase subunit L [Hydrogenimonas urashimensis]